jgi:hypothetical protein
MNLSFDIYSEKFWNRVLRWAIGIGIPIALYCTGIVLYDIWIDRTFPFVGKLFFTAFLPFVITLVTFWVLTLYTVMVFIIADIVKQIWNSRKNS